MDGSTLPVDQSLIVKGMQGHLIRPYYIGHQWYAYRYKIPWKVSILYTRLFEKVKSILYIMGAVEMCIQRLLLFFFFKLSTCQSVFSSFLVNGHFPLLLFQFHNYSNSTWYVILSPSHYFRYKFFIGSSHCFKDIFFLENNYGLSGTLSKAIITLIFTNYYLIIILNKYFFL